MNPECPIYPPEGQFSECFPQLHFLRFHDEVVKITICSQKGCQSDDFSVESDDFFAKNKKCDSEQYFEIGPSGGKSDTPDACLKVSSVHS